MTFNAFHKSMVVVRMCRQGLVVEVVVEVGQHKLGQFQGRVSCNGPCKLGLVEGVVLHQVPGVLEVQGVLVFL